MRNNKLTIPLLAVLFLSGLSSLSAAETPRRNAFAKPTFVPPPPPPGQQMPTASLPKPDTLSGSPSLSISNIPGLGQPEYTRVAMVDGKQLVRYIKGGRYGVIPQ